MGEHVISYFSAKPAPGRRAVSEPHSGVATDRRLLTDEKEGRAALPRCENVDVEIPVVRPAAAA
jgi:hypothetical protein